MWGTFQLTNTLLMLSLFSSLVGVQVIKAQQEIVDVLTVRGFKW